MRYLNLHAPGQGFASFMRALRDGRTPSYDQYPPPADGGRPTSEAVVGRHEPTAEGLTLLADIETIRIAELVRDPALPASPTQVHRDHVASFYVLEGELALTVGGRELRAKAGAWVQVPPGLAHAVSAPGPASVRYLDMRTPELPRVRSA